jgi:hypothetical protein
MFRSSSTHRWELPVAGRTYRVHVLRPALNRNSWKKDVFVNGGVLGLFPLTRHKQHYAQASPRCKCIDPAPQKAGFFISAT